MEQGKDGTHDAEMADENMEKENKEEQEEDGEEKMEDGEGTERLGSQGESEVDPDAKMLVTEYDPILVSVHGDSFIRFWTMEASRSSSINGYSKYVCLYL